MLMEEHEGEEEDEVTQWQRWERGVWRRSCKATLPTFRIQRFLGSRTMLICALPKSPKQRAGPLSGLPRNYGPYRPFSMQLGTAHRIFADLSAIPSRLSNFYCTVIAPVFLHDLSNRHFLIYPRFSLAARGLRHHYDLVSHHTRDFFSGYCCF